MNKNPFKNHIKKYRSWAIKKGYSTKDVITLLWYCNRSKSIEVKTIKDGDTTIKNGSYWIVYKGETYSLKELIKEFKL